jgi:hypothetical protein
LALLLDAMLGAGAADFSAVAWLGGVSPVFLGGFPSAAQAFSPPAWAAAAWLGLGRLGDGDLRLGCFSQFRQSAVLRPEPVAAAV